MKNRFWVKKSETTKDAMLVKLNPLNWVKLDLTITKAEEETNY